MAVLWKGINFSLVLLPCESSAGVFLEFMSLWFGTAFYVNPWVLVHWSKRFHIDLHMENAFTRLQVCASISWLPFWRTWYNCSPEVRVSSTENCRLSGTHLWKKSVEYLGISCFSLCASVFYCLIKIICSSLTILYGLQITWFLHNLYISSIVIHVGVLLISLLFCCCCCCYHGALSLMYGVFIVIL